MGDNTGSLNSKYFLIDGADGDDWYVWLNDGTGVDPAIPDRTGIEVAYSQDASATDIATAVGLELDTYCTSLVDVTVVDDLITFDQSQSGLGGLDDGDSGFTVTYSASSGILDGTITAKMV